MLDGDFNIDLFDILVVTDAKQIYDVFEHHHRRLGELSLP